MKAPFIEWAVASRAFPGEVDSGDRCFVRPEADGALLAVVDGLGHGAEAARAAELAIRIIGSRADEPGPAIVARCHEALRGGRGVTLGLARWNGRARDLAWLGVGDVCGILLRDGSGAAHQRLLSHVGVVGHVSTPLRVRTASVRESGLLVLATDGIEWSFERLLDPREPPESLANRILLQCSKKTDDALVLVARLIGEER
jgi:phosphoserine phosphatase RsbX